MANRLSDPTPPDKGDFDRLNRNMESMDSNFSAYPRSMGNEAPINPAENTVKLHNLSSAINALNQTIKAGTNQVAAATRSATNATTNLAKESYSGFKEKVHVNKSEHSGRMGAAAFGPLGAIIASTIMETDAMKSLQESAKDKLKSAGSKTYQSIKGTLKRKQTLESYNNTILSEKGELDNDSSMLSKKSRRAALGGVYTGAITSPTMSKRRSSDPVTAIDRLRISNVQIAKANTKKNSAEISKNLPKAATGGYVAKTGAAIIHKGEEIVPGSAQSKTVDLLLNMNEIMEQQLESLDAVKTSMTDPSTSAGGFFKSLKSTADMLMPMFGGGLYKSDIAKSPNPLITIASGILEQYRWQRLYGELTRNQLNELIKLQGGTQYDVYGKRGVFVEFMEKSRIKIANRLLKYAEEKEAKGGTARIAKLAGKGLKSILGKGIFMDTELFAIEFREQVVDQLSGILEPKEETQKAKQRSRGIRVAKDPTAFDEDTQDLIYKKLYTTFPQYKDIISTWQTKNKDPRDLVKKLGGKARREAAREKFLDAVKFPTFFALKELGKEKTAKISKWDVGERPGGKGSGAGGSKTLTNIDKNISRLRDIADAYAKQEGLSVKSRKVGDFKGRIKELTTMAGEKLRTAANDVASVFRDNKDPTLEVLKKISKTLTASKKTQDNSAAATITLTRLEIESRREKKKKEESEKRKEFWSSLGGKAKAGFGALVSLLSKVGGALLALGPLLLLMALNPKKTLAAMKWSIEAPSHFLKMMVSLGKFSKLINVVKKLNLSAVSKFFGGIFGFIRRISKMVGKKGLFAGMKLTGKLTGKAAAVAAKKVPFLGAIIGLIFGLNRMRKGDIVGGMAEISSGIASMFPGVGTAISLVIDGLIIARDISKAKGRAKGKDSVGNFFSRLVVTITDIIMSIPKGLWKMIKGLGKLGIKLFQFVATKAIPGIFKGLITMVKNIVKLAIKVFFKTITAIFIKLPLWIAKMTTRVVVGLIKGILELGVWLKTGLPKLIMSGVSTLFSKEFWISMKEFAKQGLVKLYNFLKQIPEALIDGLSKIMLTVWDGIKEVAFQLRDSVKEMGLALFRGIVDVIEEMFPGKGLKEAKRYEKETGARANEIEGFVRRVKETGSKAAAAGMSPEDVKQLQSLIVKTKRTGSAAQADMIMRLVADGATLKEINEMVGGGGLTAAVEDNKLRSVKGKDAQKINALASIYGIDSVLTLYSELKDIDAVEKILKKEHPEALRKNEYERLLLAYPRESEKILALMKKDVSPEAIRKTLNLKPAAIRIQELGGDAGAHVEGAIAKKEARIAELEAKPNLSGSEARELTDLKRQIKQGRRKQAKFKADADAKTIPIRKVGDVRLGRGKALGILTKGSNGNIGEMLQTASNDIVTAARDRVSNVASGGFESVSNAPGSFLKSLSGSLGDMDIGDLTDVIEGKKKIGDVLGRSVDIAKNTAMYDVKSSMKNIKNLPKEAKQGLKNIPKQIKHEIDIKKRNLKRMPKTAKLDVERQIQKMKNFNLRELGGKLLSNEPEESTIRSPLADNARQNSVQEELNRAKATVKTSDKIGKSIKESGETSSKAMTNMISSVTNNISNISGGGGGGDSSMKPSPFWKDIDQILAGNTI